MLNQNNINDSKSELVKIESFYEGGKIKPELFDTEAQKIAKSLFKITVVTTPKYREIKNGVSATQMRRIFDEVKRFDRLLAANRQQWQELEPYVRMINSKVSYMVFRAIKVSSNDEPYYKNLESFINSGLQLVKSAEDYHVFTSLFEAVYGFYYGMAPKK